MKRKAGAFVLLAGVSGLGGCMSADRSADPSLGNFGRVGHARAVPGVQGPTGEEVPMPKPVARGSSQGASPSGVVPASAVVPASGPATGSVERAVAKQAEGAPSKVMQVAGWGGKGCDNCGPGGHPGLGHGGFGGGGGVGAPYPTPTGLPIPNAPPFVPGAVAAVGALTGHALPPGVHTGRSEIKFVGPEGMQISWLTGAPGATAFGRAPLQAPARYNFLQGGVYRLKLSALPNRPGLDLYPTLEVLPATHKTATFLAHSAVPVLFTDEDLEQVVGGNFVVKVIYLPDPQFQDLATAGVEEVVSSRLEPGLDPIHEAQRRGTILAIVRIGNINLEAPNTPAMGDPPAVVPGGPLPGGMIPGKPLPGPMMMSKEPAGLSGTLTGQPAAPAMPALDGGPLSLPAPK